MSHPTPPTEQPNDPASATPSTPSTAATPLTHLDARGRARMVDVSPKPPMRRRAVAEGRLVARPETIDRLMAGDLPKGEGLSVARIAGIQAAKHTSSLIPLCHGLSLDAVHVDFERAAPDAVRIVAEALIVARTGVEMEALTAVSVAGLTLYDMLKAVDKDLAIDGIRLIEKTKEPIGVPDAEEGGPAVAR
ncbi:MAG: cyclic pyranopterin monophosphate synthase MoaC [Phycisphaerales bacterium]